MDNKRWKIALYVYNDRYCVTKGYSDEDITITEDAENCKSPVEEDTGNSGEKTLTALAVYNFSITNVDGTNQTVVTKPACLTDGTECTTGTPVAVKLNERTSGWTNIPEITYTVSGLRQDGTTRKYEDMTVTGRARLITYAEATASSIGCEYSVVGSCPDWMYANLYNTGDNNTIGYWTSTTYSSSTTNVWRIDKFGRMSHDSIVYNVMDYGLRPVIELAK